MPTVLETSAPAGGQPTVDVPPAASTAAQTVPPTVTTRAPDAPVEQPIRELPLTEPLADASAEVSALGWYAGNLILVPQFPTRMCDAPGGCLFALPEAEITAYLDGTLPGPLDPRPIPLNTGGLERAITGFEGFEAIAFSGEAVYLTIEASPGARMTTHLVRGEIAPDLSAITLDAAAAVEVPQPRQLANFSHEALLVDGDRLLLFYEANGARFAGEDRLAEVAAYTLDLQPLPDLPMNALEYRLTDTAPRGGDPGAFWALNYFYPGDLNILPVRDPLTEQYGAGETQSVSSVVERIVPMQITGDTITVAGPPVLIRLAEGQIPRNWEGLALLPGRGFLLATDKFPGTILAFVDDGE